MASSNRTFDGMTADEIAAAENSYYECCKFLLTQIFTKNWCLIKISN